MRIAFAVALMLHVLLVAWQQAPGLVHDRFALWADHARLTYPAVTEARLRQATGSRWGYDPFVHAGYPHVAVATDSHASQAMTYLLSPLGLGRARALWVVLALALTPVLAALAGRSVSDHPADAPAAGLAALALLHLDPMARLMWRYGTVGWLLACGATVLFTATFAALLHAPSRRRLVAVLLVLPLLSAHVLCPPAVAVAFVVTLAARLARDRNDARRVLGLGALVALAGVLVNAWWVVPLLLHFSVFHGEPVGGLTVKPPLVFFDLVSVVVPGFGFLGGTLGLRWGLMALGGWAAARRPGAAALPWVSVAAVALAYLGGAVTATAVLETYRCVVVAALAGAALVGPGARAALESWAAGGRRRALAAALAATVALSVVLESGRALADPLRPLALGPEDQAVLEALRDLPPARGRILVEVMPGRPFLGNAVALELPAHSHGGLSAPHFLGAYGRLGWNHAPPTFLGRDSSRLAPRDVPALLERYNVAVVVARSRWAVDFLGLVPSATFRRVVDAGAWRLYEVARSPGWLVSGRGTVTLSPGRLVLRDLDGPVTLRFHHVPGLRALEGDDVRVEPVPDEGGGLPFIRVDPRGRSAVTLGQDG